MGAWGKYPKLTLALLLLDVAKELVFFPVLWPTRKIKKLLSERKEHKEQK